GEDISNHDIHVQFVGSREGTEGDSASISVATAVISALEEVPVNQGVAMTGSLSVRGQVLPVGGVTAKIEAAAELGIGKVVIPRANMKDVLLEDKYQGKIEIVPVDTLSEVLEQALVGPKKSGLISKPAALVPKMPPDKPGPAAVPHGTRRRQPVDQALEPLEFSDPRHCYAPHRALPAPLAAGACVHCRTLR